MPESTLRLLIPGSLCDERLFGPMCSHWPPQQALAWASLHSLHAPLTPQDWCAAQLAHLPERFDVLGFSLGGLLAQALLRLAPERVRRVVLIASSAEAASPAHAQRWHAQQAQWQQIGPRALAKSMAQQANAALPDAHLELLQDMAAHTPERSFMAQGQFNASRPSGLPVLAHCAAQVCLISGTRDPWCTPAVQQRMQQARPDAQHWAIPEAGHYLPLEAPAEVARAAEQFLSSL